MRTYLALTLLLLGACGKNEGGGKSPKATVVQHAATPAEKSQDELLTIALQANDSSAVERAIVRGGNPNLTLAPGLTLLTYAITHNYQSLVELLLERGANPDLVDGLGQSPLLLAIDLKHPLLMKLLVSHSANKDVQDAQGQSALMHLILQKDEANASWLIDQGANLGLTSSSGKSAAALAGEENLSHLANLINLRRSLTNREIDPALLALTLKLTDVEGLVRQLAKNPRVLELAMEQSPAYLTVTGDKANDIPALLQLVLDQGVSADGLPSDPRPPLSAAVGSNLSDVVDMLLRRGAYVDAKDPQGESALMYAVKRSRPQMVEKLLKLGADKDYSFINRERVKKKYNACDLARALSPRTQEEKDAQKQIKSLLKCGLFGWLF